MMIKLLSTVLFLVVSQCCFSQNAHWAKVTEKQNSSSSGSYVFSSEIFDGFLFTCGTFKGISNIGLQSNPYFIENSFQSGSGGLYISKSDLNGNVLDAVVFDERYGGDFALSSMTVDSMGNILLGSTCWGSVDADPTNNVELLGTGSSTNRFAMYMKLDVNFNVIWKKTLGAISGSSSSIQIEVDQVVTDANSSMYIVGHYLTSYPSYDFNPGAGISLIYPTSGYRSPYVLKLDSLGAFEWVYHLNTFQVTTGHDLAVDSDGMVYVTGYIQANVDFDNSIDTVYLPNYQSGSRAYLLKIDNNGIFKWVVGNSSSTGSYGVSVATTLDNKIIIGGQYQGSSYNYFFGANGDTLNLPPSPWGSGAGYLVEYDSTGSILFANSYGGGIISLVETHQDSIIIAGVLNDTLIVQTASGPISIESHHDSGALVFKLDNSGQYMDHLKLKANDLVYVNGINFDDSNHIYLSGTYYDEIYFSSTFQSYNFVAMGYHEGFQTKYDFSQNFASLNFEKADNKIVLYPNPTNGLLKIMDENLDVTNIEVVDLIGVSHYFDIKSGFIQMNLPDGIYFMKVFNNGKYLGSSNFIISSD